jgi:predicted MFS family arabinose efflux permease
MMCGAAVMVLLSGALSGIRWELAFYVHLVAVLPLLFVIMFLPVPKKIDAVPGAARHGVKITPACWAWVGAMFMTYISAQVFPVFLSFLLEERRLGGASGAALAMAFFGAGGILTGLLFGWISKIFKMYTVAVGYAVLAIANALVAFSSNMAVCFAGSFMMGIANIIAASCIFIRAGMSVGVLSVGMAISLVSCAQNFGQFCSPFAISLLVTVMGRSDVNFMAFLCAGAIAAALAAKTFRLKSENG